MYPIRVRCPYLLAVHSMRVSPQRVLCECRFPPLGCLFICIDWLGISILLFYKYLCRLLIHQA